MLQAIIHKIVAKMHSREVFRVSIVVPAHHDGPLHDSNKNMAVKAVLHYTLMTLYGSTEGLVPAVQRAAQQCDWQCDWREYLHVGHLWKQEAPAEGQPAVAQMVYVHAKARGTG